MKINATLTTLLMGIIGAGCCRSTLPAPVRDAVFLQGEIVDPKSSPREIDLAYTDLQHCRIESPEIWVRAATDDRLPYETRAVCIAAVFQRYVSPGDTIWSAATKSSLLPLFTVDTVVDASSWGSTPFDRLRDQRLGKIGIYLVQPRNTGVDRSAYGAFFALDEYVPVEELVDLLEAAKDRRPLAVLGVVPTLPDSDP